MELSSADMINLDIVEIDNEVFYRISHVDDMRPFFMSIVSDSNHWLFVSSNGGITAGRKDADHALFPYCTDDKIIENAETTGSTSIFRVTRNGETHIWEPFSGRGEGKFRCIRNLYKNKTGNKVVFEEINVTLQLSFRYQWNTSNLYGFVRNCRLINNSNTFVDIRILDGIRNILPYGINSDLQNRASNLADAYKRSELVPDCGLGIFSLSAIIVDKAEPSEALKANVAWSLGLDSAIPLLSVLQLRRFSVDGQIQEELDVKGEKGAYLIVSDIKLPEGKGKDWMIVANVNLNHSAIVALLDELRTPKKLLKKLRSDVERGTENLKKLVYSADGFQCSSDPLKDTRHFSNVLFNILRGGIFDDNYTIRKWDFVNYLRKANIRVSDAAREYLEELPEKFSLFELKSLAETYGDHEFARLSTEYLPLRFSRRHGDPSRPWNKFTINTISEIDGSQILDYEGNWRDIFQNWEALAHSYPAFILGMTYKFLNASTFDGYNPYRVTKNGFDWETIEPDNAWSYIGYWGDHQVIYLLKFLEFCESHQPHILPELVDKANFVYAHVPYRIKPYEEILKNPKDTIVFDHASDKLIREKCGIVGTDGALLINSLDEIHQVNFIEKLLAVVLSKLSNFIPEAGIWMNTQRPEWNDANNALVGNGVSMVTLYYLHRFLNFLKKLCQEISKEQILLSEELLGFFDGIDESFQKYKPLLTANVNDIDRKSVMDALGKAGSEFRDVIYAKGFSGKKSFISPGKILAFIETVNGFIEHSIEANRRDDKLFHAYNLITIGKKDVYITRLSEMLEGQVAVLSSGFLGSEESIELLNELEKSALYREDQNSYLLYPNKNLPGFLGKNIVPGETVEESQLLRKLVADKNGQIIEEDVKGNFHFNGNFRNAGDLEAALDQLNNPEYKKLAGIEKRWILKIFEDIFKHKEFMGRSGAIFGYEGLGSIYWHMVSKLQLSVGESCLTAIRNDSGIEITRRLADYMFKINEGIGVHKSPGLYGAFPTDPYSHTPLGKGAQQPGMTGQVKEDILCRLIELGVIVKEGNLGFDPFMLDKKEFIEKEKKVEYIDVKGEVKTHLMECNSLFFTYCQVPVVYILNEQEGIEVTNADGSIKRTDSAILDDSLSDSVFNRTGRVQMIRVFLKTSALKN